MDGWLASEYQLHLHPHVPDAAVGEIAFQEAHAPPMGATGAVS
jgi:hypothetical protein